ncbi:MAG: trehalose-phosphatase [Leptospirillum sp.]
MTFSTANESESCFERIPKGHSVLFLDFDGTLAPIQERPDSVFLPPGKLSLLKALSKKMPVFILSGRSLADLQLRIPLDELTGASGDHGASRIYKGERYSDPEGNSARTSMHALFELLLPALVEWPDVSAEKKEYSLSVHYRQLREDKRKDFSKFLEDRFRHAGVDNLEMRHGKCVFEFRHPRISKESALLWFLHRLESMKDQVETGNQTFYPIMIGDDTTDLNAIRTAITLGGKGIWVGEQLPDDNPPQPSLLKNTEQVWEWLENTFMR